jgi:hypothetical protein
MASTELQSLIGEAEELIGRVDSLTEEFLVEGSDRVRLAVDCLDAAQTHAKATIFLLSCSLPGPAISLVGPTYRAYVRGVWLNRFASEEDVSNYRKGQLDYDLGQLIGQIESTDPFRSPFLSKAFAEWSMLSPLVQSGFRQATRRTSLGGIEPNYDEEELFELVPSARAIYLLAATELAILVQADEVALELANKLQSLD